mgnify:CR=1 FL=1
MDENNESSTQKEAIGTSWHSYPSIYTLGHKAIADLFDGPIVVQEKIDGSQFSFGRFGDELRFKSKGAIIQETQPPKMFKQAVDYVISIKDKLRDGWTYRGEVLNKPKHNALEYSRVPKHNIILFDINIGEENYYPAFGLSGEAGLLDLEVVPCFTITENIVVSLDDLNGWLELDSILGGTKIEGVVVKNYNRFGPDKKALMGKYVSEKFKEVHASEWKKANPGKGDIVLLLIARLKTEARWMKAVQHLREKDLLANEPKDIGPLMREVQDDIEKEEAERIAIALYQWAWPQIKRGSVRGLPEWYKQELAKKQFETPIDSIP